MADKRLLFWGPQCVEFWQKHFCPQIFDNLEAFGWKTRFFFPPENDFATGLSSDWRSWFSTNSNIPDYNIVHSLACSVHYYHDPEVVVHSLKPSMSGENPDLIITRANGHDYLKLLFPNTPILAMGDAMSAPWFNQFSFVLTAGENFHGLPHLEQHPEMALSIDKPDSVVEQTFDHLSRLNTATQEKLDTARCFFDDLRKEYDKIYLYPADFIDLSYVYLFNNFDTEPFSNNADLIRFFESKTDEKTALLVTQHPLVPKVNLMNSLADLFPANGRVKIIDDANVTDCPDILETAVLSHYCDGTVVRNSKAFWFTLFNDKPVLNLGSQDLAVIGAHTEIEEFLKADRANVSRDEAIKIFYWYFTRQRIGMNESYKTDKMLAKILNSYTQNKGIEAIDDLYEWGTEADYLASFTSNLEMLNTSPSTTP